METRTGSRALRDLCRSFDSSVWGVPDCNLSLELGLGGGNLEGNCTEETRFGGEAAWGML